MSNLSGLRVSGIFDDLNERFQDEPLDVVLAWIAIAFGDNAKFACSFGAEDMVLLHAIATAKLPIRPFVLDTGRLHQETYDLWAQVRTKYGVTIDSYAPDATALQQFVEQNGPNAFYASVAMRKSCCFVRKVEPLNRALAGSQAWITGQRREQSVTRTDLQIFEVDAQHGGIMKISPLANWTEEQIWAYLKEHQVPYNRLHDQGFPSIGWAPCTRAVRPGEDLRAGRWWWESPDNKECGLHPRTA